MPVPGVPNNPSGVNSFDHFAPEPAYGEATKQKALAGAAPMAGGQVAAGALNSAGRAQAQAVAGEPQRTTVPPPPAAAPMGMPPEQVPVAPSVSVWQEILATPGAEKYPILAYYAGLA